MQTLRDRHEQGFARGRIDILDGGADSVVVVAHPAEIRGPEWPEEVATIITFHQGKVTTMRDFRTKEEALAALR